MNSEFVWDLGPENAPYPEPLRISVGSAAEVVERDAKAVAEGRQKQWRYFLVQDTLAQCEQPVGSGGAR